MDRDGIKIDDDLASVLSPYWICVRTCMSEARFAKKYGERARMIAWVRAAREWNRIARMKRNDVARETIHIEDVSNG